MKGSSVMKRIGEVVIALAFTFLLGSVGACEVGNIEVSSLITRAIATLPVFYIGYLVARENKKGR